MPGNRLFRIATRYTLGLWLAGFAWLEIVMGLGGRLYGGLGLLPDLAYIPATLLFAFGVQAVVLATIGRPRPLRLLLIGSAVIAATLASGLVDTVANYWVAQHFAAAMRSWATGEVADWLRASFLYGWVYGLNVAVIMLVVSAEEARAQARQLRKATAAAQAAQLTMLRYQINPHFLFNALNAVSSLVLTRQNERAEQMIERLSAFLRSSNSSDPTGFVTLADELSATEEYLEVEAIRFGERMIVALDVPGPVDDLLVPSFLLQPIVENAVKYAVSPAQRDVTIRIAAHQLGERLQLTIDDDGDAPPGAVASGTGIGLRNVRERLAAFYGAGASFAAGCSATGYCVTLEMPAWREDHRPRAEA